MSVSRPNLLAELRAAPPLEEPSIAMLAAMILELREDISELRRQLDRKPSRRVIKGMITLKDAAFRVGYSSEALRLWAAAGEIDAKRYGGQWYVNLQDVEARAGRSRPVGRKAF